MASAQAVTRWREGPLRKATSIAGVGGNRYRLHCCSIAARTRCGSGEGKARSVASDPPATGAIQHREPL